jgi:hypothetical protein
MEKEDLKHLDKEQLICLLLKQEELIRKYKEILSLSEEVSDKWKRLSKDEYSLEEAVEDFKALLR